jgi:HEPN domain-containing protein
MQLRDLVREWLDRAEQDAATPEFLLQMHPRPDEIIGFHAQQAVEKAAKDSLVSASVTPTRTHDLVFLHQLVERETDMDVDRMQLFSRLTPYVVEHRYPITSNIDPNQVEADVREAVS